jgi:hypothetical protein
MRQPRATTPIARPGISAAVRPQTSVSRSSISLSLPTVTTTFRPRATLAVILLLVPAALVLVTIIVVQVAALSGTERSIAAGIAGGMTLGWLAMVAISLPRLLMTIHVTSETIEIVWPWGASQKMIWRLIDRVEMPLGNLSLHSSDGKSLLVITGTLTDGSRLTRLTLLRVSPTILSPTLQQELALLGGGIYASRAPIAIPPITIAPVWPALATVVALAGTALAVAGTLAHDGAWLAIGVPVGLLGVGVVLFLRQTIILSEDGITVVRGLGKPRMMRWQEAMLIERAPLDSVLALRDRRGRRVVMLGPFYLIGLRRDLLRDAFSRHLLSQGVNMLDRWWVW